ncbi:MAG: peptidoglycan D,D-transpeptidase FtsI family protein [Planctomycetota bacterium]
MTLNYAKRLGLLGVVAAVGLVFVVVRLYDLQISDRGHWEAALDQRSNLARTVEGQRGRILDAAGKILAADGPGFDLMVVTAAWDGYLHRCRVCTNEIYIRDEDADRYATCPRCKTAQGNPLEDLRSRRDLRPLAQLLGRTEEELIKRLSDLVIKAQDRVEEDIEELRGSMSEKRRERMRIQLRRSYGWQPVIFHRDVPYEVAREVMLYPDRNPPFRIRETRTRRNFGGPAFAHLVGREPDVLLRARLRARKERGGTGSGLESAFDIELRGEPGFVRKAVDPKNPGQLKVVELRKPIAGLNVRLTMSRRDQEAALGAISDAVGAFVVVNANTGAVLALVSSPTYDPEHYQRVVNDMVRLERRAKAEKRRLEIPTPLLNRAVIGMYPPGSTMKPFTGIAGVTGGVLKLDEEIRCDRLFVLNGKTMLGKMTCMDAHGPLALDAALVCSCNIYFQSVVNRLIKKGNETGFIATANAFGFGESTGLKLEPGRIARLTFALRPEGRRVPLGARIQAGIGQGLTTATPAQVARAYAALATGHLPRLHLVASVGDRPNEVERRKLEVSPALLEAVRAGLHRKTARDSSLSDPVFGRHRVATKTGTAQRRGQDTYTAWLAGFAGAQRNRPAIAFAMVVEQSADYGGVECGRRVAQFLDHFYGGDEQ